MLARSSRVFFIIVHLIFSRVCIFLWKFSDLYTQKIWDLLCCCYPMLSASSVFNLQQWGPVFTTRSEVPDTAASSNCNNLWFWHMAPLVKEATELCCGSGKPEKMDFPQAVVWNHPLLITQCAKCERMENTDRNPALIAWHVLQNPAVCDCDWPKMIQLVFSRALNHPCLSVGLLCATTDCVTNKNYFVVEHCIL